MNKKDPIENKFKSAFAGFEQEPPAEAWSNLERALHPDAPPGGFLGRIASLTLFAEKPLVFYIALAGISLGLFVGIFYFGSREYYAVRGHAYAGDVRLAGGVATLFEIDDKALPWDSLNYRRSDNIDPYGHFRFSGLKPGNYLLRIAPEQGSANSKKYKPSWFDAQALSDSARVIVIDHGDVVLETHLIQ
jgi:hypothetical protein